MLLLLAAADLRTEVILFFDHPTVTALIYAVWTHPLAVMVLVLQPSLWRRYGSRRS